MEFSTSLLMRQLGRDCLCPCLFLRASGLFPDHPPPFPFLYFLNLNISVGESKINDIPLWEGSVMEVEDLEKAPGKNYVWLC